MEAKSAKGGPREEQQFDSFYRKFGLDGTEFIQFLRDSEEKDLCEIIYESEQKGLGLKFLSDLDEKANNLVRLHAHKAMYIGWVALAAGQEGILVAEKALRKARNSSMELKLCVEHTELVSQYVVDAGDAAITTGYNLSSILLFPALLKFVAFQMLLSFNH